MREDGFLRAIYDRRHDPAAYRRLFARKSGAHLLPRFRLPTENRAENRRGFFSAGFFNCPG